MLAASLWAATKMLTRGESTSAGSAGRGQAARSNIRA